MKFAILRARLLDALNIVIGVVDKKPTHPAMACVRICAMANGTIQFSAMNLTGGIRRTEPAIEVGRAGAVALNAHDLRERMQKADAEDVTFALAKDATRMSIRSGAMGFSMGPFPLEEVPELAAVAKANAIEVPAVMAARAINAVSGRAYQDVSRPNQHQVRLLADNGHMMSEATDGHQCIRYDAGEWEYAGPPMILSLEGARILADVAEKQEIVHVRIASAQASFIADGTEAYAAQFDAAFPPVEGMFAVEPTVWASINRDSAISWVRACLVSGGTINRVAVSGEGGLLVFRATDTKSEAIAETRVPFQWEGSGAVDGTILVSSLQSFESGEVTLGLVEQTFQGGKKGCVFTITADGTKTKAVISGQQI